MSTNKDKAETPPVAKERSKKRSLVERELETSLSPKLTTPLHANGEGVSTSRFGRTRHLKNHTDFCETDKAVTKVLKSQSTATEFPVKSSPTYKKHSCKNHEATERTTVGRIVDTQIENIYNTNISLSRFGIEEKKQQNSPSPNPKSSKVYIRKDMIQTREKEETVTLIKNMFSPTRSTSKSNSHLNVVLERNSEKYNLNTASSKSNSITKNQNGYFDNSSVVKTLDFDSSKKKKAEVLGEGKQIFSKTKNFETKSMSPHPVTDSKKNKKERSRPMRQRVLSESESFELDAALLQVFDSGKKKTRKESEETILLFSKSYEVPLNDSYENKRNERVRSKSLTRNRSYGLRPVTPEVGNRNDKKKIKEVRQNKRTLSRSKSVDYQLLNSSKKNNKKESGENKLVLTDKKSFNVKTPIRESRQTKKKVQQNKLTLSRSKSYDRLSDINKKTKKKGRNKSFSENKLFELESVSSESSVGSQRKKKNVQKNRKVRSKSCDQLSDGNRKIKKRDGGENKQVLSRNQSLEVLSILQVGDSSKKKKKKDISTPVSTPNKQMLSKNELFELEAKSPYQLGDIVWARMGTFPFWPCIVTREPGSDMFVKKKIYGHREHYNVHVTFFADNGRRSWILDNMLRNYQGFDEFEAAREQFTPEAKKKDPRLYSAFFISDKKLALWHTSIEEADSLLKEPKRLRIDLLNEMLMNPPIIKYTPSKIPKRRITNRNDSDVSLSESLYDTLFSQVDGDYETPRKQKNKSLDVSEVVTACLDNMAAKTGITKIQKQSHMDIWLQKAKSQTPEKSQFNINITVERMDQDNEKDKPKRVSNRRKKSVSLRDPLHKPYSFRKSTESQHLLANQNEHDYSALGAEHSYSEHQQNTIGNTNEDTESDTPPICIIDQVISLKDADKTVQDEILANEVRGNLTTEIITLQGDATMEEDKIANEGEEVMRETDIDEKEQVIRQTNIDAEEQVIRKTEIDQEANTEMTDSQSITEETNKNQSTDFLQDTETEQIVNDIDASDKMESVEENFQDDNVENEVQPTTFPDKEDTSEKETGESVIIIISQTIQTETREIEPQIESHVNEKKDLESALHTISKENEVTIKNETFMEIDEENELQSISLSAESIENNPEEEAMETISESIGILSTENKSQPASQTFEEYALDNMPLPLSQLVITGDVCNESQTFLEAPQVTTQPFLEENLENEQHSIASSQSVANESDENKTHTHQSVEIKDTLTSVGAIDLTEPKVNRCDIDNGLFSKKIPIIESELDVISQVSTDDDKTSCNTNLISDSTRLTPITDLKEIMEETEELVTPKKTEVPTCQQNYDKIMYNNIASVLTKQNLGDKDKLTEIINDCEKLIPSSHLNKNQEVRKTRKSLRKKSKPESKTNLSGDRDTPSIKPKDSASSTKRKANSKSEPEKMKEPEFLKYLELRQDALMDEHPELCYEEIEAYLYKTWQYEYECHKSEVSPSVTNESNENKPQAPKSSKINTVENGPQSTSQSVEQYTLAINSKVTQPVKDIIVTHVFTKINEPVSTRIDNEKVIVIKPQNVANLDEEVELAKEPLPALEYNLVYDEYDSEDSEPSPEYEPIEEIMEKEKDIFTAFVKAAQNDVTQEKIMRENEKTGEHLNQSNHEIKSTEYVHKQQKATTRPSSNLNLSKDDDARSANHSTESTSTVITEIMNTTKSSPTMSKISNDGDRTSCNTNLISDSSRITPVTDLKQIMEETEKLGTIKRYGVSICQQDNPTVLKIKTLADKVTDITDVPDKLVASSDTLNKRQETDKGNELKKPRRSLRDKSKADSKINEVSNDQLIATVNKDKVHEKSKTVTRGSKYNENELETLKVNMIKKTDESVLDVIKTTKKTSKQGKVIENGHLELVTNTVSNHNISDSNFIPESTDTKSTEKSKKKQIPIVAVENSSIVVNGLVETSDKKHDAVNIENSVCDTFSLRSEISSLTVSGGDDIDDKDFDPETISLSSLSSAISDVSVVAPRKLTRKTSFHDRRNINGIVTKKDIDRIRAELLQDSDNESVSSSEDVALSELKTRSEDTVDILRQSVDSAKSDSSGRRLKVMITDCLMKPKENKLPKVKEFSSETDVEYEIVNSPSEFSDPSKRLHLRLKKTSPTKPEKNIDLCRKESPTKLFPKVQSTDVDSALLMTKNLPSPSRKDNNKKQKSPKKSECVRSPKTKQKSPKAVSTEQEDDVFDIPLSIRRKSSPNAKKSTVSVVSPLKTKSPKTRRKSFSTCSPPKTNSDSKVKYPSRQSIISETKLTSSLDFNAAFAQSLPSSAKALLSVQTNLETKSSKISEPMPTTQVNGLHSRPSSPELQLKEPELDTISINSNDSVSSTKRKGKGRADYEKMKEPEFIQYLELKQDNVMDEHPELCYEEIVAYLYKTWQYEESRKSDLKKTDELENANLVKGVNEQSSVKPKQKAKHKRLINIVKVMNDSINKQDTIDLLQRELPKRKASKPFYKEEFSDIEEEIEMFEIFKKKPKSADLKVEPKQETVATIDDKKEIRLPDITTESIPVIPTKSEKAQVDTKEEIKLKEEEEIEEYFDQEEMYFEKLTKVKPNIFKGLIREKVCEICEETSNLVKCKGCNGMFHVDCVNKVDKPVDIVVRQRGRKKKNRNRGRKPKSSLESNEDGQSDEKYDPNASEENASFEEVKEIEPIVIIDVDDFESKLEAKMKEIIKTAVEYDSYSSDDGIDWSDTVAGKCEIVDVKLKPRKQAVTEEYSDFKCKNCQKHDVPICFVCKSAVSPRDKIDRRQRCQVPHCHKYYHLECLEHWPQTQFNTGELSRSNKNNDETFEAVTCPRHVCHTCVCDDPRGCKTRFSGDKLARCVRCPATYHSFTKCLPAGSQILSASHIVCPRHYQHRPGKVPYHVNTGWCFICALGGKLICCDFCPTSFHADCLNIEPPEGGYMCEDCETGRLPLYGEMVWVKLGHYRWWPGIVLHPSEIPDNIMAVRHSPGEFVVRFFGQYDHYWVNRGRVFPFQEGDSGRISTQKSKIDEAFTKAMEHAQRAFEILKNVEPNDEESQDIQSSLLPPHYVKLKVNKPCGALYGKKIDIEESSLTQCECNPDEEEPCGPYSHCLNRMLLTECGPTCRAGERCQNRQFEKRQYPKLVPYRTPHRGWGLKTLEHIKAGQFVIEYVGELIDEAEFRRRMRRKHEMRDENFYFLTLDKERMIDAGPKGNLARFMNHCCEPNCETQKWTVLGDIRVGLFAINDIPANTEVTFNYNLECTGIEKKQCMCGAKRCAGYIGAKPKQEDPQPKKAKMSTKMPTKRPYKKRTKLDSPSTSSSDKNTKLKRPIGRPPKPKPPRELTEIEKDLLIIKNATNGLLSSDSETSVRHDSADMESDKVNKTDQVVPKPLKRKRVSFSAEESVVVCNGVTSPSAKKHKLDGEQSSVGD